MISIQLLDSVSDISSKVNKALALEINKKLSANKLSILSRCKMLVNKWILDSPEVQSLASSNPFSLAGLFGIPIFSQSYIREYISEAVANSTTIELKKFDSNLSGGGLSVFFQPSSFTNLLGLSEGHVLDSGLDLHWMKWILQYGDTTIVTSYSYDPTTGRGRSGLGTMTIGGGFRVPPEFSGTMGDNFITRSLLGKNQNSAIAKIFRESL